MEDDGTRQLKPSSGTPTVPATPASEAYRKYRDLLAGLNEIEFLALDAAVNAERAYRMLLRQFNDPLTRPVVEELLNRVAKKGGENEGS